MKYRQPYRSAIYWRATALLSLMIIIIAFSTRLRADAQTTGTCSGASVIIPFTDVPANSAFFCQIAAAYFSGLTNGTTATTFSPTQNVTREQMAAFITRTLDQSLKRGNRRAALKQWATPSRIGWFPGVQTVVGDLPQMVESDGADLWVTNYSSGSVSRVRASDSKLLDTFTGMPNASGVFVVDGLIWVTGFTTPGKLYAISPQSSGGPASFSLTVGDLALGIAYDGTRIWTANNSGSVSILSLDTGVVTTVTNGFSAPVGVLYDGSHIWVTDEGDETLKKLSANGAILQSIPVGLNPRFPVFDGTNIWVPNISSNSVTVVRVKDAQGDPLANSFVLETVAGNGLNGPVMAAFDGQRVLVTNEIGKGVSLWKAVDLRPLGFSPVDAGFNSAVFGACSDGINFWVTLRDVDRLARF
jgi:hypothetical protein